MLAAAFATCRRALSQGGTWTALAWMLLFLLVLMGVAVALGASLLTSLMTHPSFPGLGGSPPKPPLAGPALSGMMAGIAGLYVVILGIGPLFYGGLYGLFAQAVQGEPVGWSTFWSQARRCYGRAWGILLYAFLFGLATMLAFMILLGVLHAAGVALGVVLTVLAVPWAIRMAGGLFVDRLGWRESFGKSFRGPAYWSVVAAVLLTGLVYLAAMAVVVLLIHAAAALGLVLYWLFIMALSVAGPVWLFSVYRAEQDLGGSLA
jgi:hypothetical protein